MFRCCECNKEFDIKPDYCDCGNDVFLEIKEEIKEEKKTPKKSFEERYPSLANLKKSLDPISLGIFLLCIILSILSLIFIGFKDEIVEEEETTTVQRTSTKNIDDFWDDKPASYVEIKKEIPKQAEDVVKEKKKETVQTKKEAGKEKKPATKTQIKSKTPVTTTSTAVAKTSPVAAKTPAAKTSTAVAKTKTPVTTVQNPIQVPKTNTNSSAKIQTSKIQVQPKTTAQKPTQSDLAELKKYKNALRNKIYSYIDFTSIIGEGTCVITFKISGDGRLINRNFTQKSGSVMLNDAVYNAMLNVSSYKQPPAAYNGETLKFTVKFFSGEYEVSLN